MAAWEQYFLLKHPKMGHRSGNRIHYAVLSIQQELHFNNQNPGVITGIFNQDTKRAVESFQHTKLLEVDGIVGPITAKALLRRRIRHAERKYEIPNDYLCGLVRTESAYDFAATGSTNPEDRGVAQINHSAHPDVTNELAFNAEFSIHWAAKELASAFAHYKNWRCAIASYNAGVAGAMKWCQDNSVDKQLTVYVDSVVQGC